MIQQISTSNSTCQIPQQGKQEGTSEAQKTDSFQSLMQAAQSAAAKAEGTDGGGKKPGSGEKIPKDEKDTAKDAAALVPADLLPVNQAPAVLCQTAEKPEGTVRNSAALVEKISVQDIPADAVSGQADQVQSQGQRNQSAPVQVFQTQDPTSPKVPAQAVAIQKVSGQTISAAPAQTVPANDVLPMENPTRQDSAGKNVPPINSEGGRTALAEKPIQHADGTVLTPVAEMKPQVPVGTEASAADAQKAPEISSGQVQAPQTAAEKPMEITAAKPDASGEAGRQEKKSVSAAGAGGTHELADLYSDGKVVVRVSDVSGKTKVPIGRQVADAAAEGLKAGKHQLTVDLYPQSLGKLSIKLISEGGMLTVEIAAANPKTQSLLASSSGEIRSMLHASTGQEIQVNTPNQSAQQFAQQQQQDGSAGQNARQQQQEQAAQQKPHWLAADGMAEVSTDDFLSILKQTGVTI